MRDTTRFSSAGLAGAGFQGPQGDIGPTGAGEGFQGPAGIDGSQGPQGPSLGPVGPQGAQGSLGGTGIDGVQGVAGQDGVQGIIGPQGFTGNDGVQGLKGDTGVQGVDGNDGVQGPAGSDGVQGDVGPTGPVSGQVTLDVVKSSRYNDISGELIQTRVPITFYGSQGAQYDEIVLSATGATGIQGPQGGIGPQGSQGSIGVTGADSTVAGPQGVAGNDGVQGAQGPIGITGVQGVPGPISINVTQGTHGFVVGDAIYNNAGTWTKAKSDVTTTLGIAVVIFVTDGNNFTYTTIGPATLTSHGFTIGQYLYVSAATAGLLTATEPTGITEYSNPIAYVLDANTLLILPWRPMEAIPRYNDLFVVEIAYTPYSVTDLDELLNIDATGGSAIVNLPTPSADYEGFLVTVKKIDSTANTVTVKSPSGTIDGVSGATGKVISTQYEALTFVCDGTNWWIV